MFLEDEKLPCTGWRVLYDKIHFLLKIRAASGDLPWVLNWVGRESRDMKKWFVVVYSGQEQINKVMIVSFCFVENNGSNSCTHPTDRKS